MLFIISTFSTEFLTFYSRICGNFFNFFFRLSIEILSPTTTIFVIGNMIILILFSNYGNFSAQESGSCNNAGVYSKHLEFFEENANMVIEQGKPEIYEEKNISVDLCNIREVSKMQRSKSEVFKGYHVVEDHSCGKVTRSYRKSVSYNNRVGAEMTGDEFRQMVEGFIARQQRSLREQEEKDEFPAHVTSET